MTRIADLTFVAALFAALCIAGFSRSAQATPAAPAAPVAAQAIP